MARFADTRLTAGQRKRILQEITTGVMLQTLTSKIGDPRLQSVKGEPSHQRIVPIKAARNQPCPCGSGKKFKHCCKG